MKSNNIFHKKNKAEVFKSKKSISLRKRSNPNREKVKSANVFILLSRKKIN
jgi:hypothetical protein